MDRILAALHADALDRGDHAAALYYEIRMSTNSQDWLIDTLTGR